jgi:hypothetical protein
MCFCINQLPVSGTLVAVWVQDMFCNFYFAKYRKISKNSTTVKAREEISSDLQSLEFYKLFHVCLTKKNIQILLNIISHRFLLTTKLFTG